MTGVTDFTQNNNCSRCGQCCSSHIPLTYEDIVQLRKYIKKYNISPSDHAHGCNSTYVDLLCPFLNNDDPTNCICTVYDARPAICKLFSCSCTDFQSMKDAAAYIVNHPDTAEQVMSSSDRNTQQLFYPKLFCPDVGSTVMIYDEFNPKYPSTYQRLYIVTDQWRSTTQEKEYLLISLNNFQKRWAPVSSLHTVTLSI